MSKFFILIFLVPSIIFAKDKNWQDAEAPFNARENSINDSIITWKVVDNVQKTCESESHKRRLGGFNYPVDACSFWSGGVCTIVTGLKPTQHILGHEVLHCFRGNYH
jgi:hypothetical protein